jgi:hypothetical protein
MLPRPSKNQLNCRTDGDELAMLKPFHTAASSPFRATQNYHGENQAAHKPPPHCYSCGLSRHPSLSSLKAALAKSTKSP